MGDAPQDRSEGIWIMALHVEEPRWIWTGLRLNEASVALIHFLTSQKLNNTG